MPASILPVRRLRFSPVLLKFPPLLFPLLGIASAPAQTTHTWIGASPGEWGLAENWSSGLVPGGNLATAVFNNTSPVPATVAVGLSGSPFTVRGVNVSNGSPYGVVVLGSLGDPAAQSLTLSDGTGAVPAINVSSGTLELSASLNAGAHFSKTGTGTLLLTGPTTSSQVTLDGGRLHLSGSGTVETMSYKIAPTSFTSANTSLTTGLYLWGAGVVQSGTSLALGYGNNTFSNATITAEIDLGGLYRKFKGVSLSGIGTITGRTGNSVVVDIRNGALETASFNCDVSLPGSGNQFELRLPESATVDSGRLTVGTASAYSPTKLPSGRLRIGANATLRLGTLYMGYNGSSGRIDALAPGSTLTLSGRQITSGDTTTATPISIEVGNTSMTLAGYDSGIDMENGTLNLLAKSVILRGASCADAPAVASLRFGAGDVEIADLRLGYSTRSAFDHQCLVVQKGGNAKIQGLVFDLSGGGTSADRRTYQYLFSGGTLSVGNVTAPGNITLRGTVRRGIEWTSGTLKNYAGRSAFITTTPADPVLAPLDLSIFGGGPHPLEIESNQSFTLGAGSRLSSESRSVTLTKLGNGTLVLAGDSSAFTGLLKLDAGRLALGETSTISQAPLGGLIWNAGVLALDLSATDQTSDRLTLARTLTKGPGGRLERVIDLKSSLASGTFILATYASTDLTVADFIATGIPAGRAADFTIGPTALSVTVSPASDFSAWRSAKLSSPNNLGDAADDADPDADGLPNLLEYALGSEPLAADSGASPAVAADPVADRLTFAFTRIADPALTYSVYAAEEPSGPWSGEGAEIVFTSTGAANVAGPINVSDSVPLSTHPRRFLRLVVSR